MSDEGRHDAGPVGCVLSVRGARAVVGFPDPAWNEPDERRVTVGGFIGIRSAGRVAVGVVTDTSVDTPPAAREQGFNVLGVVELMGEIRDGARFTRGVTSHPAIGDRTCAVDREMLQAIYDIAGRDAIDVGRLQQARGLPAYVGIDEMLSRHFAVLGSTGVGKSSGVAVLLGEVMARRPDLRIFLVDPHNEYGRCFGDQAQALTPSNLKLPFWLFSFEEIVDVLFRGRPPVADEREILAEVIPIARQAYAAGGREGDRGIRKSDPRSAFTVDTPVPYRVADVMALIDERMGRLEVRAARGVYGRLMSRIDSVVGDPRYGFMFENANVGGDTMAPLLQELFRLPTEGRPMTIMQLAGFPGEVVDAVVSVLARMAFDFGLWSDGKLPLLFVCEEAHRYAPADRAAGFAPTRRSISRIAKEGRKYGVFLGLVTQRPAELDPTILSQCSTMFVMRMSNERDQALVRAAVSDAAANILGFLATLGTREAFAFGEGVSVPMRLMFKELPPDRLPLSIAVADTGADLGRHVDQEFVDAVVDRWRSAALSPRGRAESQEAAAVPAGDPAATGRRQTDPNRPRLLRKAVGSV